MVLIVQVRKPSTLPNSNWITKVCDKVHRSRPLTWIKMSYFICPTINDSPENFKIGKDHYFLYLYLLINLLFFFIITCIIIMVWFSECAGGKESPCNGHGKCEVCT